MMLQVTLPLLAIVVLLPVATATCMCSNDNEG